MLIVGVMAQGVGSQTCDQALAASTPMINNAVTEKY